MGLKVEGVPQAVASACAVGRQEVTFCRSATEGWAQAKAERVPAEARRCRGGGQQQTRRRVLGPGLAWVDFPRE